MLASVRTPNTLNLSNPWLTAGMLQLAGREEVGSDQRKRDKKKKNPLNRKAISISNSQVWLDTGKGSNICTVSALRWFTPFFKNILLWKWSTKALHSACNGHFDILFLPLQKQLCTRSLLTVIEQNVLLFTNVCVLYSCRLTLCPYPIYAANCVWEVLWSIERPNQICAVVFPVLAHIRPSGEMADWEALLLQSFIE